MKKKIAVAISLLLVLALSVGGTIAWLTDSDSVTNTFTIGNVDITLTETDADNDRNEKANEYHIVPGATVAKDPKVTVRAGSEKCYVFVRIEEKNNAAANNGKYIEWNVDSTNWTPVAGEDGVYMYKDAVDASDAQQVLYVLQRGEKGTAYENGYVTVNGDNVTKAYVDTLTDATRPQLIITAYAVQYAGFETDVAGAWAKVDPTPAS